MGGILLNPLTLRLADAPDELQLAVAEFWPPDQQDDAVRIAWLESGWNWDAEADTRTQLAPCGAYLKTLNGVRITAEHSIGYFQINACNFPDWNPCHFFNPRQNAGTARLLFDQAGGSWGPWYFSAKELGLL